MKLPQQPQKQDQKAAAEQRKAEIRDELRAMFLAAGYDVYTAPTVMLDGPKAHVVVNATKGQR